MISFNHYERLKIEDRSDPHKNIIVPAGESLTQSGIWVAELFPPSYYTRLHRALAQNGWDKSGLRQFEKTNADQVERARRKGVSSWTRLGAVKRPNLNCFIPDAKPESLPSEFDVIELTAVQIGSSLTAVVAFVRLSEEGASSLSRVWKGPHEPLLEWRGLQRPAVDSRYFGAIRATQRERERLHDLARAWLTRRCGGYFASTQGGQPVVDFNLFHQFDPTAQMSPRNHDDALRALGMQGDHIFDYVSPELPGIVFVKGDGLERRSTPLQNCWGAIGAQDTVAQLNEHEGYGEAPPSARTLATIADRSIRRFLLHLAVVRYGQQLEESMSAARDTARLKHSKFSPREVEQLQRELLNVSFDLPAVARDSGLLWKRRWRQWDGINVRAIPTSSLPDPPAEFDFIDLLGKQRKAYFKKLLEEDETYRTILATSSSLGASASTTRLASRTLLVSGVSLIVSLVALLVSNGDSVWEWLLTWF